MLIPKTLPDELIHGYVGRLKALNVIRTSVQLFESLRQDFCSKQGAHKVQNRPMYLAAASGLSPRDIVKSHSLIPFLRAVAREYSSPEENASEKLVSPFSLCSLQPYLCPDCVEEDLAFWGFTYWRRSHQLPGIEICLKHDRPLMRMPYSSGFDDPPNPLLAKSNKFGQSILKNGLMRRYAEIALEFLERDQPVSSAKAYAKIGERAHKLRIRLKSKGPGQHLYERAVELVPKGWLISLFPEAGDDRLQSCFPRHRVNAHEGKLPVIYAHALATLFDSSDEALTYWYDPPASNTDQLGESGSAMTTSVKSCSPSSSPQRPRSKSKTPLTVGQEDKRRHKQAA
ncbi:MAG: TniQ family protein [Rhodocyclaceae bacterium]|nr:TniQ family protein [Rhodocyclaceae bacterium]MCW5597176.1 TniQ family protein [Rhodocyclaceae bacterium]